MSNSIVIPIDLEEWLQESIELTDVCLTCLTKSEPFFLLDDEIKLNTVFDYKWDCPTCKLEFGSNFERGFKFKFV